MKKLIWLASYPKSGNTWMRAFLTNLLHENEEEMGINELIGGPIASSRSLLEDQLCVETSDFTVGELEALRPGALRSFAEELEESPKFLKIHDAYTLTEKGEYIVPADVTIGAIYIVRNPLDVAVSFAHHNNLEHDEMISEMANPKYAFCRGKKTIKLQTRQKLLTWGEHVSSWMAIREFPVLLIRYEDMLEYPDETFGKMVKFSGLNFGKEEIKKALDKCTFDKLQKQEEKKGFSEKNPASTNFFRKGKSGSWRDQLTQEQADKILTDHYTMMKELGYLDAEGKPLF